MTGQLERKTNNICVAKLRNIARRLQRLKAGMPVRLLAEQYAADGIGVSWSDFPAGHYAQECFVDDGVYGVMESNVRIVSK